MNRATDPAAIRMKLEGLYRDRERLAREFAAGQVNERDVRSVNENIVILEAQLRADDAAKHHVHSSESDSPEHD